MPPKGSDLRVRQMPGLATPSRHTPTSLRGHLAGAWQCLGATDKWSQHWSGQQQAGLLTRTPVGWEDAAGYRGPQQAAQQERHHQPTSARGGRQAEAEGCKALLWCSAPGQTCQPCVSSASVLIGSTARVHNQETDVQIRESDKMSTQKLK